MGIRTRELQQQGDFHRHAVRGELIGVASDGCFIQTTDCPEDVSFSIVSQSYLAIWTTNTLVSFLWLSGLVNMT